MSQRKKYFYIYDTLHLHQFTFNALNPSRRINNRTKRQMLKVKSCCCFLCEDKTKFMNQLQKRKVFGNRLLVTWLLVRKNDVRRFAQQEAFSSSASAATCVPITLPTRNPSRKALDGADDCSLSAHFLLYVHNNELAGAMRNYLWIKVAQPQTLR